MFQLIRNIDIPYAIVLLCFALSGFAALVYETVWMRQFSVVFGTSNFTASVVLAAYMAGLALGGALASRWLRWIRSPLRMYAAFEFAIAAAAVLWVPLCMRLAQAVKVAVFGGQNQPLAAGAPAAVLFDMVSSFMIILAPTMLMGATLPLLARHVITSDAHLGNRIGILYSVNTLGAVSGTLTSAFFLLPRLGLHLTILAGAAVNVTVFGLGILLCRIRPEVQPTGDTKQSNEAVASPGGQWIMPLMLISGATSFAWEILWTRMLGHVVGASVFAFATMLASFLLGIGLGSAAASRFAQSRQSAKIGFVYAQIGTAAFSLAVFHLLDYVPQFAAHLQAGEHAGFLANVPLAILVLLPSTLCLGATFPFAVRIAAGKAIDAGAITGRVYAWNTVGAILGAIATGQWLLPMLRYEHMALLAISVNVMLAGTAYLAGREYVLRPLVAIGLVIASIVCFRPRPPLAILGASPFYEMQTDAKILHYATGRSSTVVLYDEGLSWTLRTNGLPEAVIDPAERPLNHRSVAAHLGTLPILLRPELESVAIIGLGGGAAVASVPPSVKSIDVFELESEVIEANRLASEFRSPDPLQDPRVRIICNDARNGLLLTSKKYGAIVSQPSHPWTGGASHLYTSEFLALAKERLTDRGIFLQWMSAEFLDDELFRSLVATMLNTFSDVRLYSPDGFAPALLFVGSDVSFAPEEAFNPDDCDFEKNIEHFARHGFCHRLDSVIPLVADRAGLEELCQDSSPVTDNDNRLALRTPSMANASSVGVWDDFVKRIDPLCDPAQRREYVPEDPEAHGYVIRRLHAWGGEERAERYLDAIQRDSEVPTLWHAILSSRSDQVRDLLSTSALRESDQSEVRYIRSMFEGPRFPLTETDKNIERNSESLAAVLRAMQLERQGEWNQIEKLDSALAQTRITSGWLASAIRLRVEWRIRSSDATTARSAEAIDILDTVLAILEDPQLLLLRARAAYAAGNVQVLVGTTQELVDRLIVSRNASLRSGGASGAAHSSFVQAVLATNIESVLADVVFGSLPDSEFAARARYTLERLRSELSSVSFR